MADGLQDGPSVTPGFGYFVLKLRLAAVGHAPGCAGMIERLGTADRRNFENADELLRLLAAWASDGSKMT